MQRNPFRPRTPVAAAERIETDDGAIFRIEECAGTDDTGPPVGSATGTREGVRNQNDVRAVGCGRAVDRYALLHRRQDRPVVEFECADINIKLLQRPFPFRAVREWHRSKWDSAEVRGESQAM